jgi:uncharacterized protein (DUF2235 family)
MNTPRNLVVCSDGTGQLWGSRDSNVVRIVRHCAKDERQLVFYDPGVGTDEFFPPTSWVESVIYRCQMLSGLALGKGIYENVSQCYQFLVENYRQGDRIFLFGFSRGAFTVRSVSGLIRLFGIVRPDARPLLPLMLRAYFASEKHSTRRHELAADIKQHFTDQIGHQAKVHFIGVWDTVESVGGLSSQRISASANVAEKPYGHIRHAVSVGEYRAKFAPRLYETKDQALPAREQDKPQRWSDPHDQHERSFEQRWFCGVHIDVGGGANERAHELAYIPLRWLVAEAESCGLQRAEDATYERLGAELEDGQSYQVHDQPLRVPFWALTGLARRSPPATADCDPSLRVRLGDARFEIGAAFQGARDWCWLLASLGLSITTWLLTFWLTSRIPDGDALELARVQLNAPWVDALLRERYSGHLAWPLVADFAFIAASTTLLCVLSVHAVRSLRNLRPEAARVHRALRWALQLPLCGAVLFDLLENVLTPAFFRSGAWYYAYPLASASALKFICWIVLLTLFAFALVRQLATRSLSAHKGVDAASVGQDTTT